MLYIYDNIDDFDTAKLELSYRRVSAQRRDYAKAYHNEIDRKTSVIAYLLLQQGLRREYDIIEPPEFAFADSGRPILPAYPQIHFSLSHCRRAVACAISTSPIGVDVERIREISDSMVEYCCNDSECREILASDDKNLAFANLWTRKESYLKMVGTGIAGGLKDALVRARHENVVFNRFGREGKGYVGTVCGEECVAMIYCENL